jgi:phosphatidylglycerophosphate synthase
MLYKQREKFDSLSMRVGKIFSFLTPNQWTSLSFALAVVSSYFIFRMEFFYAAVALVAASFLDVIDGSVARFRKMATSAGAYLDTITDRYVEAIIIMALLFAPLPKFYLTASAWLFLYFFGGMMTTYAKAAAAEKLAKSISGGLLERAERMIILILAVFAAGINTTYTVYIIAALAVLANITALQRISSAR